MGEIGGLFVSRKHPTHQDRYHRHHGTWGVGTDADKKASLEVERSDRHGAKVARIAVRGHDIIAAADGGHKKKRQNLFGASWNAIGKMNQVDAHPVNCIFNGPC